MKCSRFVTYWVSVTSIKLIAKRKGDSWVNLMFFIFEKNFVNHFFASHDKFDHNETFDQLRTPQVLLCPFQPSLSLQCGSNSFWLKWGGDLGSFCCIFLAKHSMLIQRMTCMGKRLYLMFYWWSLMAYSSLEDALLTEYQGYLIF